MKRWIILAAALASATLLARAVSAEPVVWAIQAEQFEYRVGEGSDIYAWDAGAFVGKDELRLVWRSEAEYAVDTKNFETLENQFRLQTPISDFFDAVAGVRFDTPQGPDRIYGVLGIHGLAPQWFEVDLDLFLSEYPPVVVDYKAAMGEWLLSRVGVVAFREATEEWSQSIPGSGLFKMPEGECVTSDLFMSS